jgi:hypothetical protein
MSLKNSSKTTGNRTRDMPVCSALNTTPPRAPFWCVPYIILVLSELKISLYRSGQALRVPGVCGSQTFQTIDTCRWLIVRTGRIYLQKVSLVFISVRGWVDLRAIVRPEGLIIYGSFYDTVSTRASIASRRRRQDQENIQKTGDCPRIDLEALKWRLCGTEAPHEYDPETLPLYPSYWVQ